MIEKLKPHFDDNDIPYIYLPFLRDTIDMSQPQQIIDAEVAFALDGNWDTQNWGNRSDFWKYLVNRYGDYRIMKQFTENSNGILICDNLDFNKGAYPVLISNHDKYERLANALNKNYDVLEPYNIFEENARAEKNSKLSTTYGMHTDTNGESSMDSAALINATQTQFGSHTDDVVYENNVSVNFENEAFESGMSAVSHMKNRRKGNLGNMAYADLIEKEIKLARFNFWDIICKDLIDNICLKFFESC